MATVTRENIGLLNDKITVKVSKDDYLPNFEKSLKNFSKNANIPGFRKGMVPAGLVRKMHGQAVLTDEVLRTIEKELSNYMVNEKLEIFGQPLPLAENDARQIDLNNPADYSFGFEVGLKPEFEVVDLSKEHPALYKVEITDEMISDEIDRLRLRHGKMSEPEEITGDDNVINVTFTEVDESGNPVEGGISKDNSLLAKYFREDFRKQLIGKKKDDVLTVQLDNAFEGKEKDWVTDDLGLKGVEGGGSKNFSMLITKVGMVEKSDFNEEFFQAAFPGKEIKNEEDLKNTIRTEMEAYWSQQAKNHLQHELYHVLLEKTHIEFPSEFLKRWIQSNGETQKSMEQAEEEYPVFANQLKWSLITDKVIKEQKIDVQREDLVAFAKNQLFSYLGGMSQMGNDQQWVDDYVNKMMQDKKYVEETFFRIQTDKVFEWAETQVNPSDKKISVEEFTKILQEHQHEH